MENYIPISRRLFEHQLWCEERKFSRFEAWLDIVQSARFEDTKQLIGNRFIKVKRGQMLVSLRFFASRWQWSTKKVNSFLDLLIQDKMITKETPKETGQTVITVCNYDKYNFKLPEEETQKKQQGNKINKDNNINSLYTACAGEKIFDRPLYECYEELMNNRPWIEQFVMNLHAAGYKEFTPDMLLLRMNEFFRELQNRGETVKSAREAQNHFANWLRKELKENNERTRTASPRRDSKTDGSGRQKETSVPATGKEPSAKAQSGYSSRF